jgi:hypothetical protein
MKSMRDLSIFKLNTFKIHENFFSYKDYLIGINI